MTQALAERETGPMVTAEQIALITRTVAKDATPDELKLYLYDCARQGVHPLDRLIHFTKRAGKYTPITSIDFMRIRAAETNEYAGSDDAVFADAEAATQTISAATVTVWRLVQGQRCPFTATARWSEYKPADDFMWRKMPHTMLAKCAEALALRKGFPRQLAGLYAKEEMDQAGEPQGYTVTAGTRPDTMASGAMIGGSTVTPETPQAAQHVTDGLGNAATIAATPGPFAHPNGVLHVLRVERKRTKNPAVTKFIVVLSDGRDVTTIKSQMGDLAEAICQDGDPVTVETKTTQWGEDLVALHRAERVIDIHDHAQHTEPVDEDSIPF